MALDKTSIGQSGASLNKLRRRMFVVTLIQNNYSEQLININIAFVQLVFRYDRKRNKRVH